MTTPQEPEQFQRGKLYKTTAMAFLTREDLTNSERRATHVWSQSSSGSFVMPTTEHTVQAGEIVMFLTQSSRTQNVQVMHKDQVGWVEPGRIIMKELFQPVGELPPEQT